MKSFEERLARLEQLTQLVKAPQTPLAEAVAGFEEGFKLAQTLEKELETLEKRVEILVRPQPADLTAPKTSAAAPAKEAAFDLFGELPKA